MVVADGGWQIWIWILEKVWEQQIQRRYDDDVGVVLYTNVYYTGNWEGGGRQWWCDDDVIKWCGIQRQWRLQQGNSTRKRIRAALICINRNVNWWNIDCKTTTKN